MKQQPTVTKRKRKTPSKNDDDTPKDFRRLMQRKAHLAQASKKRPRPEDVTSTSEKADTNKKRKISNDGPAHASTAESIQPGRNAIELPRIQPHERLSDYGARIDASMPIAGLQKRGNMPITISGKTFKQPQTRTEKKMQRMQAEWRAMAEKRKEKAEAEADERESEELEKESYRVADEVVGERVGGKKRGKRGGKEDDPWAILESRRKVQKGLGDVVQRPPDLGVLRGKLKLGREKDAVAESSG